MLNITLYIYIYAFDSIAAYLKNIKTRMETNNLIAHSRDTKVMFFFYLMLNIIFFFTLMLNST